MEQTEKIKCKINLPPIKRHRTSITLLKQFMRRYCGGCLIPKQKKGAPKYYYDDHVLNINTITTLLRKNMSDCKIPKDEVYAIKALDSQKNKKKRMYGGGYLVSDKISSMLKDKRDRIKQLSADYTFPLSEREKQIVEHINKRKK